MRAKHRFDRVVNGVIVAVALASSVSVARGAEAAETAKGKPRPNVLFLFSDDQRADTIGAWGNKHAKTPNLDRLVAEGTSFTRAYCMGSQQGAVCVPSRAMLLTGRTLFRVKDNLQGQETWPERFAADGYRTFVTGKWHNGPQSVVRAFREGEAVFLGGMGNDPYKLAVQDISPDRKLVNRRPSGKHSVELFADAAVEFLSGQGEAEKPFLCYVSFNLPHDPRVAPTPFHEAADQSKPPPPANFMPQHPFDNGEMAVRDELLAPWPRTPDVVRQHLADYYAAATFMDQQVGRVLDALKRSGRYENTIIVFASDHGLAIGSHGLFGKQNLYDHSMRAPLIVAGPGVAKGRRTDALCYLLDVYPTLGDLSGVTRPEGSEGVSLAGLTRNGTDAASPAGGSAPPRRAVFTAYRNVQRAVRDDRWKLIVYPQVNKVQLFDLQADPDELKDLAADPAHAADRERMTELLKKQQAEFGDVQPLSSENPKPLAFDPATAKPAPPKQQRRP